MQPFWKQRPDDYKQILDGSCIGDMQECVDSYLYKHKATKRLFCMLEANLERMRGEPKECLRTDCPINAFRIIGVRKLTEFMEDTEHEQRIKKEDGV